MQHPIEQTNFYANDENTFNLLYNCNCCQRHNTNKPKSNRELLPICKGLSNLPNCKCECRHLLRWFCRIKNEQIYPANLEIFNNLVCQICDNLEDKDTHFNIVPNYLNNCKISEDIN